MIAQLLFWSGVAIGGGIGILIGFNQGRRVGEERADDRWLKKVREFYGP